MGSGKQISIGDFDLILDSETESEVIDNETLFVEKVDRSTKEDRFVCLDFNSGEKYPYSEVVYDGSAKREADNPRESEKIELKDQTLVMIDAERGRLYISNQKKQSHVEKWLAIKIKQEVTVKPIMNEGELIERLKSVSSISLTAVPSADLNTKSELANQLGRDAFGYGAERATLTLNYDKKFSEKTKDTLKSLLGEKEDFTSITLCGKTTEEFEAVFNTDTIVYKIRMGTKVNAITGKFNTEDAFLSLIIKIRKQAA